MAFVVVAYVVMTYAVMAYVVMAYVAYVVEERDSCKKNVVELRPMWLWPM